MSETIQTTDIGEAVLNECRQRGVRLRIREGRVSVVGHRLMNPHLWSAIENNEPEVIAALKRKRAQQSARLFEFRLIGSAAWLTLISTRTTLAAIQEQIERRFGPENVEAVRIRWPARKARPAA